MGDSKPAPFSPGDTRWADGLRGIASIFVVSSHLVRAYCPDLLRPKFEQNSPVPIYNYPFIRVYAEGFPWVAVFFILTGFVNALKPVKLARGGQSDAALSSLASSAFRRTSRLVLPCTVSTIMSWALCQLGGYEIARLVDSEWLNYTSPARSKSVLAAFFDLITAIYQTWARSDNFYDRNQWTMEWFLKGSMVLFVTLLATVKATSGYRSLIFLGLFLYGWECNDAMVGLPIYGGALLAELSYSTAVNDFAASKRPLNRIIAFSLLITGWYLMSYPARNTEWAPWSNALLQIGTRSFPSGAEISSFWDVIGVLLLTSGILLSATVQGWLCHPWLLWLGHQSFPIYLLHGPLLRSLLNWMLFAFVQPIWYEQKDDYDVVVSHFPRLSIPSPWRFAFAVPTFFATLLYAANYWTQKIEPWCAYVTVSLEDRICGKHRPHSKPTAKDEMPPGSERCASGNGNLNGNILPM